jgi:hypothetical protein
VGTDKAHIQHVAILEGEEPSVAPAIRETNRKLQVLAISISVFTLLLLVAVVLIWRRFQREKLKKQQVFYFLYTTARLIYELNDIIVYPLTRR